MKHTKRAIATKAERMKLHTQNYTPWTKEEIEILKEKYPSQGIAISELLKKHTKLGIRKKARLYELNYVGVYRKNKRIEYVGKIKEICDGILLGDGGFEGNHNQTAHIAISQVEPHSQWLYTLKKRLEGLGLLTSKISRKYNEHHGKLKDRKVHRQTLNILRTFAYVDFKNQMPRWGCINLKKTKIPDNCSIEPETIALWYMGDGDLHARKSTNSNRYQIRIATHCFSKESQQKLKRRLEERYGWNTKICNASKKYKAGTCYFAMYCQKDILNFLKMTKPYMISCFDYKWRALNDEKWRTRKNH